MYMIYGNSGLFLSHPPEATPEELEANLQEKLARLQQIAEEELKLKAEKSKVLTECKRIEALLGLQLEQLEHGSQTSTEPSFSDPLDQEMPEGTLASYAEDEMNEGRRQEHSASSDSVDNTTVEAVAKKLTKKHHKEQEQKQNQKGITKPAKHSQRSRISKESRTVVDLCTVSATHKYYWSPKVDRRQRSAIVNAEAAVRRSNRLSL